MTQVVLAPDRVAAVRALLLGESAMNQKRVRASATARRAPERSRARTPLAIEMPPRSADRCGGLPAKQGSVEEEISRSRDRTAPKKEKKRRGARARRVPKANKN